MFILFRISLASPVIILFSVTLQISKDQCVLALDFCDWNVLKAIKLAKLQHLTKETDLNACGTALDASLWDVTRAAQWILSQEGDILQV